VSNPRVEVSAVCEVHGGSGRLVLRRGGERVVLDGRGDQCCSFTLGCAAVTLVFDVIGEWLG
jgi:hypothetical protein